eukprot:TRINITY_DN121474_c0_g1_i1.p1 TRINITY_DN121474_c0_g1~~TRINITY_DN121474_c0_g1_i1.p1  ORF type:complete len:206 (+),score=39.38 TRINITY_DN121474_c0_g1_i1:80-697(+)
MSAAQFLTLCFTATLTKLAASIDDTVWLMPFMLGTKEVKMKHGAVYVALFVCEVLFCTAVTSVLAILVGLLLPTSLAQRGWEVTGVMQVLGGLLLAMYSAKLKMDGGDDDEDDEKPKGGGVYDLVVIGILGSLDDMCLQASLLAGGVIRLPHMLVGVIVGCSIVIALCIGASSLKPVVDIVQKIPLWSVVGCLSAYTFLQVIMGW